MAEIVLITLQKIYKFKLITTFNNIPKYYLTPY